MKVSDLLVEVRQNVVESIPGSVRTNLVTNPSFEASSGTVTVRTNLCTNPSFETGVTGWNNGYNSTFASSTAAAYSGTSSVAMTSQAAGGMGIRTNSNGISASSNTVYTLSVWVRSASVSRNASVYLYGYASDGVTVTTSNVTSANTSTTGWTQIVVTHTTAATTAYLQVRLEVNATAAAGEVHYFDAVMLEQSSVLGTYFDGSTTASGDFSYGWSGTANASTSLQTAGQLAYGDMSSYYTATIYKITDGVNGSKAAAVRIFNTAANPNGFIAQPITASVPSGTTVTASMYIKGTAGVQVVVAGRVNDTSGSYLTEGLNAQNIIFTGSWQRVSVTYAYTGVAYRPGIQAIVYNTSVSGTFEFYVDSVLIEQSSTLGDYFDGSTSSSDPWLTYAWTGTSNASTSTRTYTAHTVDRGLSRVGQITGQYLVGFNCVLRYNAIGTWTLTLPSDHPMQAALTTPGAGIIVSLLGQVLLSGPVTWIQTTQTVDIPEGVTQVTGLDDSVLLRDRLAYPTPSTADVTLQTSAYDIRSGVAETVIKQYVNVNMGSLAPATRKISTLDIEGDFGRGVTVKGSARFDILYDLITGLTDASMASGSPLGFEILQSGSRLKFLMYAPVDRSKTVRMDIFNNRVTETNYSLSQPTTTRAIVGGQGDLTARTFLERSNAVSLAAETSWGRRIESFVDSRDSADSTALATAGDTLLGTAGKAQITANVKPTDDTTMLFGKDWYLGDTVTVVVGSYELAAVVSEMGISVAEDGVRLYGTVGEPKTNTYERQILARQQETASRLSNLERYK